MRSVWSLLSLALGCGRVGFEVCAGCANNEGIQRVAIAAPGSSGTTDFPVPFEVSPGELVLVGTYAATGTSSVTDSLGETWNTLPEEKVQCTLNQDVRFFYAIATHTGPDTITAHGVQEKRGAFVIGYSGVDETLPVDVASGRMGPTSAALDGGSLTASGDDQVVALFAMTDQAVQIAPGPGLHVLAHDDVFSAMIEDISVGPGDFTATASVPTPDCWVGVSVALRPR